jgi:hypothetical protein
LPPVEFWRGTKPSHAANSRPLRNALMPSHQLLLERRNRRTEKTAGNQATHETKSQAMEILKERFARGEIDKAEFEERRQVLASA